MDKTPVKIRLMKADDFEAVVTIDERVLRSRRQDYYEMKFEKLVRSREYVPASLVAEAEGGRVVGFVMGELFIGEYGISQDKATLDTIGVDPEFQQGGIGELLIKEFIDHVQALGVDKINTLVDWDDSKLIRFFSMNGFSPSKTINLERNVR